VGWVRGLEGMEGMVIGCMEEVTEKVGLEGAENENG
jgi:hypothetical protein